MIACLYNIIVLVTNENANSFTFEQKQKKNFHLFSFFDK